MYRKLLLVFVLVGVSFGTIWAQNTVSGTIKNESGEPVIGAAVVQVGTTNGAITDENGSFSITAPADAQLKVTMFGFESATIDVNGRSSIEITMNKGFELDNVVITAMGIEKEERALGYSVQTVDGGEIATSSEFNVLNALSGKVAGVQIGNANGVEGGTTRITIRGNNSLVNGKNQPLIIVDGVQIENSIAGAGSTSFTGNEAGRDWGSGINNINAWDIEEINVLKGPNAAALYGARGANGVIIITTKKGTQRKGIGVDFNTSQTVIEAFRFREVQNVFGEGSGTPSSQEFEQDDDGNNLLPRVGFWGSGVSWGPKMEGQPVKWWNGEILPFEPQPDNVKSFFQTGRAQSYNVAFSGASEIGSVRASLTNTQTTPITPNTEREQNTINLNTSINVTERLTANASVSYMDISSLNSPVLGNSESSIGKNVSWNWGRSYRPELEANSFENPDGTRTDPGVGFPRNDALGRGRGRAGSFFWNLYKNNEWRNRDRMIGGLSLNLEILPWLHLEGRAGLDNYNDDNENRNTPRDPEGLVGGRYARTLAHNRIQDHTAILKANKALNEDIRISVNLGAQHWSRSFYSISGRNANRNFVDPFLYSFRNIEYPENISSNWVQNQALAREAFYDKIINSVFGAIDLEYKDYLYLTLTGRNDWSSTLPIDANSYFYPSASLGFVFTEVMNMNSNVLSFGKLRLAFSNTANDTDPYQLDPTFSRGSFAGQPTSSVRNVIPPTTLRPEQTNSYDIGLDLRFFNGRLNVDATYYYISSTDQILQSPLPLSSGFSALRFNTGEIENKGWEFLVTGTPVQNRNFGWQISLNASRNRNKIIALADGAETFRLGGIFGGNGPSVEARPGEDYGTIMGWDYVYRDLNGNEMVDDNERTPGNRVIDDNGEWYVLTEERVPVGNIVPDWIGGVTNTFRWKNFTLNTLVDVRFGGDIFFGSHGIGRVYGQSVETLDGRSAEYGGLPYTDTDGNTRNIGVIKEGVYEDGTPNDKVVPYYRKYQDTFGWGAGSGPVSISVFDGSYARLRELSLSYSLPKSVADNISFIQNLSITLLGRNLWFLYNNAPNNLDPTLVNGAGVSQGMEWGSLPSTRNYGALLKVGF